MYKYFLFITMFIVGCEYIKSHPDNPLEEFSEEVIEDITGLDIDITSNDVD